MARIASLLRPVDASRRVGVAHQTIFRAIRRGTLKSVLIGTARFVRMKDVDEWAARRTALQQAGRPLFGSA